LFIIFSLLVKLKWYKSSGNKEEEAESSYREQEIKGTDYLAYIIYSG
jgi:hypothetical protein